MKFFTYIIILSLALSVNNSAHAATTIESFGSSCYTLNSGLSLTFNGAPLSASSVAGTAYYSAISAGTMTGCSVRLQGITSNTLISFPSGNLAESISLDAYAVNGPQTIIVNFTDSTTQNWIIPDTVNPNYPNYVGTFNFNSNGKSIGSLLFTPSNNPDIYLIDNITWVSVAADSSAPTFNSNSSFSASENIAITANAATIKVSESATITISAGADASLFNIVTSDSVTAFIRFKAPPDFEAPSDVGANNVYEVTLSAVDAASNTGTQSITITVADVVDTSSFNSLALAGSATTATYRTSVVVTASVTVASKVTFRVNGRVLPGCIKKLAAGSGSSFSATCNWRPSNRGVVVLTATATPTGAGISSASATPVRVAVGNRSGRR